MASCSARHSFSGLGATSPSSFMLGSFRIPSLTATTPTSRWGSARSYPLVERGAYDHRREPLPSVPATRECCSLEPRLARDRPELGCAVELGITAADTEAAPIERAAFAHVGL